MKAKLRRTPFREFANVFRFFLLVPAAIGFFSFAAGAQTVDKVIAKNIQAKGGADKLKSVRTVRITTKFSQGSFRAEFRQEISSVVLALAQAQKEAAARIRGLAEQGAHTDERLNTLIRIVDGVIRREGNKPQS